LVSFRSLSLGWAGAATGFAVSFFNHLAHENGWFDKGNENTQKTTKIAFIS